jgi:HJR/Mrr/RecB family endonuclease
MAGAIWLQVKNVAARLLIDDTLLRVAAVAVAVILVLGCLLFIRKRLAARKKKRLQHSVLESVYLAAQEHLSTLCAEKLRQSGWKVQIAQQSADQAVDVIAEKDGTRIVLRCKQYAGPVGDQTNAVGAQANPVGDQANTEAAVARRVDHATNGPSVIAAKREPPKSGSVAVRDFSFDWARWNALLESDAQLRTVAVKLRPLGGKWVDRFAASYLAANDRTRLSTIVAGIIAGARMEFEQREAARMRNLLGRHSFTDVLRNASTPAPGQQNEAKAKETAAAGL